MKRLFRRQYHLGWCNRCRHEKKLQGQIPPPKMRKDVYCQDHFGKKHPFTEETTIRRCRDFWIKEEKR